MTPAQLVDDRTTPGPSYVFGTDTRSNKDWQTAASIVAAVAPATQAFGIAASTWTWNHNLGYRPLIEAYDSSYNQLVCDIQHTSVNQSVAIHQFNATGHLIAR